MFQMCTVYCFTVPNLCIIHACMYESVDLSAAIHLRAVAGSPFHKQELCIYKLQDTGAGGLFLKYGSSFYLGQNHSKMARQWLFETAKKKDNKAFFIAHQENTHAISQYLSGSNPFFGGRTTF